MNRRYILSQLTSSTSLESVDVFILLGQSNEASRSNASNYTGSYLKSNPNIKIFYTLTDGASGNWVNYNCTIPNNQIPEEQNSQTVDTAMFFGELYYQQYGKPAYFIKSALGGTPLASAESISPSLTRTFYPTSAGTPNMYLKSVDLIENALNKLTADGKIWNIRLIDWFQGESDAGKAGNDVSNAYQTNFNFFISTLRNYTWTYNGTSYTIGNKPVTLSRIHADLNNLSLYNLTRVANVRSKQGLICRYHYTPGSGITDMANGGQNNCYMISIDDIALIDSSHIGDQETKGERVWDLWYNYIRPLY
jgi:hypothetical protein